MAQVAVCVCVSTETSQKNGAYFLWYKVQSEKYGATLQQPNHQSHNFMPYKCVIWLKKKNNRKKQQ